MGSWIGVIMGTGYTTSSEIRGGRMSSITSAGTMMGADGSTAIIDVGSSTRTGAGTTTDTGSKTNSTAGSGFKITTGGCSTYLVLVGYHSKLILSTSDGTNSSTQLAIVISPESEPLL